MDMTNQAESPQLPLLNGGTKTNKKRNLNPLSLVLILSFSFFVLFLGVSAFLVLSPSTLLSEQAVGVIEVSGIILDSKKTLQKLDQFEENEQIKAVVLRLNSPGGAVAPSQEIYQAVKSYPKPVVVSMGSVAASGAYYIACGAKKVFANPGSLTGSIGVIMEFTNLQRLYEWAKVQRYVVKTGAFKDTGAEYRTMTVEERALLQGVIDNVGSQFKKAVMEARGLTAEQMVSLADGRIFSGAQAKAFQLVDELGTLKDAIQAAAHLAKIKGKPTVVYPDKKKKSILDLLTDDSLGGASESLERFLNPESRWETLLKRLLGERTAEYMNFSPGIYWIWGGAPTHG